MAHKIAVGVNGFIHRAIRRGQLSKEDKTRLAMDIINWKRTENLRRLNANRSDFIK